MNIPIRPELEKRLNGQYGWICPNCGKGCAPSVPFCCTEPLPQNNFQHTEKKSECEHEWGDVVFAGERCDIPTAKCKKCGHSDLGGIEYGVFVPGQQAKVKYLSTNTKDND